MPMFTRSWPASGMVALVGALAGCGSSVLGKDICEPLPAGERPAQLGSFAWGAGHALWHWNEGGNTRKRLLRSTDLGDSFCVLPTPEPLEQFAAIDGSPMMFGVVTRLFRSQDASVSWEQVGDGLLAPELGVPSVVGLGSDGPTVWIWDQLSSYHVSRDAAATFRPVTLPVADSDVLVLNFLVDPARPARAFARMFVLTDPSIGVRYPLYRTDDAGQSWDLVTVPADEFGSVLMTRSSHLVLQAMGRLWLGYDGGDRWWPGMVLPLYSSISQSGGILSLSEYLPDGSATTHYWSDDGETWHPNADIPGGDMQPTEIAVDPVTGTALASTPLGLFRSRDRVTWTSLP